MNSVIQKVEDRGLRSDLPDFASATASVSMSRFAKARKNASRLSRAS